MNSIHYCKECGSVIAQKGKGRKRKFCSDKCRFKQRYDYTTYHRICPVCFDYFETRALKQRYCSVSCGAKQREITKISIALVATADGFKQCSICGKIKDIDCFNRSYGRSADGYVAHCKECQSIKHKEWASRPEVIKKRKAYNRQPDQRAKQKSYNQKAEIKAKRRKWEREQNRSNPKFILSRRMRTAIWNRVRKNKGGRKWETLVGYTLDDLFKHIEKQFLPGMSWDNFGEWHIDHIIPVSAFNYEKPSDIDFKKCWDLKNLQPLWGRDNIRKNAKILKHHQPAMVFKDASK